MQTVKIAALLFLAWAQLVHGAPSSESPDDLFAGAAPAASPFTTAVASPGPRTVQAGSEVELRFRLTVPDSHWVYLEHTRLEVLPSPGYEVIGVQAPAAVIKLDPFLEKEVEVYKHDTEFVARVRPGWSTDVTAVLSYQGCNATVCFFPTADTLRVALQVEGTAAVAAPGQSGSAPGDAGNAMSRLTQAANRGIFWLLLFVFGAGFLTSLTPCVYPMIPITIGIIGARSAGSRTKGFSLSLLYVLGIAFTYSTLGTTAALTGSLFGNALQNAWVVAFVAAVFVVMALSMFGAFELQVPAQFAGRMNRVQGSGYPGAFLLGLVSGVVASPCIGPVLVAMLAYVGAQGNALLGFLLFFTFALGLGVLFVALGTFTGLLASVPRSGSWMIAIKTIFGLVFLGMALYFLHPLLAPGPALLAAGVALLVAGFLLHGWRSIHETEPTGRRWGKAMGRAALVAGLYAVAVPLFFARPGESHPGPAWLASEPEGLRAAQEARKPMLVDFSADWCVACKELEHVTFSDARVIELAQRFVTVRVDATRRTPEIAELLRKYNIVGLPWVAFVLPDGSILQELTVTGFIPADAMLERMQQALAGADMAEHTE